MAEFVVPATEAWGGRSHGAACVSETTLRKTPPPPGGEGVGTSKSPTCTDGAKHGSAVKTAAVYEVLGDECLAAAEFPEADAGGHQEQCTHQPHDLRGEGNVHTEMELGMTRWRNGTKTETEQNVGHELTIL